MIAPERIDVLLDWLKQNYHCATFAYADANLSFRKVVKAHFGTQATSLYGVYVVRQQGSAAILYIGKGGTLNTSGQYKGQDIIGRLINVRGDINADAWFGKLVLKYGAITVEYVVLRPPLAPAYVEAALLQAFLSEQGHLPVENKCL